MNITTELIEITPKLAQEYLAFLYAYQRPENKFHTNYLAKAMLNGLFDPTSNIALAKLNGKKILLDGQHTLRAIITSGKPQCLLVSEYNVISDIQIARLYSHFNIGKSRNFTDSIRAYQLADKIGLTNTQINRIAAAIRYQSGGFPRYKVNIRYQHEEMIEKVEKWKEQGLIFFNTISHSDVAIKRRMESAPILSVCLIILKYAPQKGVDFVILAQDDGLKKGDPRKALLNYLKKISQHTGTGLIPQSPGHISRAVAKSWGKFYDGLTLNQMRINSLDVGKNIVIKGTPYTGKFPTVG